MSLATAYQKPGLRVALIAGGLWKGGAEKQFVYMAEALQRCGVTVRCYCLTRGDFYEARLTEIGLTPTWIGRFQQPAFRVMQLHRLLREFRPQIVQAGHFYANLYAALGARSCGAISIGAVRNDGAFELRENKFWGPRLLRLPDAIIANSHAGARHVQARRRSPGDVIVVPNVIDLGAFDATRSVLDLRTAGRGPIAVAVGRLVPAKRYDLFLQALARARQTVPDLRGVIVGEGPERASLEQQALLLDLDSDAIRFVGARDDVAALLRQADFLVSSSDHEGFPNVILEAMAARLPVVTTPAGDAASVILPGVSGIVVPHNDVEALAAEMRRLASAPSLRQTMGMAARKRVELLYGHHTLANKMLTAYDRVVRSTEGSRGARAALSALEEHTRVQVSA